MHHDHNRRVLVVHDDPVFTAALAKVLRAFGFVVDAEIDCRSAILHVEQHRPDVVCVSLNLPRDSGYDLCELIRKNPDLSHVQIVVLGDRHSPEVVAYAEEAGANAFLTSPVKIDLLAHCISAMLDVYPYPRSGALLRDLGESLTLE